MNNENRVLDHVEQGEIKRRPLRVKDLVAALLTQDQEMLVAVPGNADNGEHHRVLSTHGIATVDLDDKRFLFVEDAPMKPFRTSQAVKIDEGEVADVLTIGNALDEEAFSKRKAEIIARRTVTQ